MIIFPIKKLLPGIFFILPFCTCAQNSVWEQPGKLSQQAGKHVEKTTGAVKKWKKHLQQWGLDSSYNHSLSLSGKLNTNGWSLGLSYQQPRGSYHERRKGKYAGQSTYWSLHFSEVKHEKQIKQQKENNTFPELGAAAPFVFGKINNLYVLQLGYGREQLLLPGVLDGNLSVGFRYSAGFSLAMLKPYYLRLMYVTYHPDPVVELREERYSDDNQELFLNRDKVFGGSVWSRGLDEIRYVPGVFADAAFTIIPSVHKSFIQTISLGGQFAAYTKSLPIMADSKAYPFVAGLYVGLSIGKRW